MLRGWKDKARLLPGDLPGPGEQHIDISGDTLSTLLHAVQQDLAGFLATLRPWAQDIAADLADPLTAAAERRLQISAPLDICAPPPEPGTVAR